MPLAMPLACMNMHIFECICMYMYVYVCICMYMYVLLCFYQNTNAQAGECIELTDDGVSSHVLAYDHRIAAQKIGRGETSQPAQPWLISYISQRLMVPYWRLCPAKYTFSKSYENQKRGYKWKRLLQKSSLQLAFLLNTLLQFSYLNK